MSRALRIALVAATLAWLSGCGVVRGVATGLAAPFAGAGGGLRGVQTEVGGLRFRTRIAETGQDGRGFSAVTSGAGRSLAGAVEAGRTQAHAHCLRRFGGSEIVWTIGPDRPVGAVAVDDGGRVTLSGTCVTR